MKTIYLIKEETHTIKDGKHCFDSKNANDVNYDNENDAIKALREMARDLHCDMLIDEQGKKFDCCWQYYFMHDRKKYFVCSSVDISQEEFDALSDYDKENIMLAM